MTYRFTIVILILLNQLLGFAQNNNIYFEHLTKKEGLSNNNVYCTLEDNQGFLWIGTSDGLNKYDGKRFKIFRTSDNVNSVSSDCIHLIARSKKNNHLWIATHKGLDELDLETEKFKRVVNYSSKLGINVMFVDSEGIVWFSNGDNGLDRLDYNSNQLIHYSKKTNALRSNRILAIGEDDKHNIWIKQNHSGILKLNKKSGKFTSYFENEIIEVNNLCTIIKSKDNQLWLHCGIFIYRINTYTLQICKYSIPMISSSINYEMKEDKDGNLLIGSAQGLYIFNPKTAKLKLINARPMEMGALSDNYVQMITESTSKDVVWIGTRLGINKYTQNTNKFNFFSPRGTSDNAIWGLAKDKNKRIWFATRDNLYYIDNQKSTVRIDCPNGKLQTRFLKIDINGNFWMSANNQLCSYSPVNQKFTVFPAIKDLRKLYIDKSKKLWIATKKGLYWYDSTQKCVIPFLLDSVFQEKVNLVNCLMLDNRNRMWIGTLDNGLRVVDILTKKTIYYTNKQPNSLSADDILSLLQSSDGTIWVGTYSGGLNRFNPRNQTFSSIRKKNGLLHESVYCLLEDQQKRIWLSSNNGITCFEPKNQKIQNYDYQDGVLCSEFNHDSYYQDQDGEVLFGGLEGFVSFFPDKMSKKKIQTKAILTDFKIFNQSVAIDGTILKKHISYTSSITLPYHHSMISFDFAVLDFSTSGKSKIAYCLEGFDTRGWNNADNQNSITYANLSPGTYTFLMKVANREGVFDQPSVHLKIIVTPPFWKTWWAYLCYISMLIVLLIYLRKIIIWRTQRDEAMKYERLEKEMEISLFTNISHEFRTPLTLIISPLEHLLQLQNSRKEDTTLLQIMHKNAHTLLNLINQVLDFRKYKEGKMKLQVVHTELVQFVRGIYENFSYLSESQCINYTFHSSMPQIECWFDSDKVEKILTNLISNAFKYSHKNGIISVSVSLCETASNDTDFKILGDLPTFPYFQIIVEDNGIGMERKELEKIFEQFYQVKANSQSSGIGLNLTANLTRLHNGQLSVKSEKGMGSQFTIRIPADRQAYTENEIVILGEKTQEVALHNSTNEFELNNNQLVNENSPLLLIVEDNEDMRNYIKYLLIDKYRILEAENGEKGIALACENFPDLIISDVMMPRINGLELCKQLKNKLETSHIPILLLTALATTKHNIEGLECGADDYITKPFNEHIFLLCIKRRLETCRKYRERFSSENPIAIEEFATTVADREFLEKAQRIVNRFLQDENFNVDTFASEIGISRTLFFKKMKVLTNLTPNDFVQNIRLRKAAELLLNANKNVSEVAYEVGFGNPTHFSRSFKEMYKVNPSQYGKKSSD